MSHYSSQGSHHLLSLSMFPKERPPSDSLEDSIKKADAIIEDEGELDMDEEDRILERKLSKSFFNLSKQTRERLQETIPLKILKRLKNIREGKEP